jgi:hypothetical protein
MRSLPHQGAKHGVVDHSDASDGVFIQLHPPLLVVTSLDSMNLPCELTLFGRTSLPCCDLSGIWLCLLRMEVPTVT